MPSDLIAPAFVLTLVPNAVLIALALRTFARERSSDRPTREPDPGTASESLTPEAVVPGATAEPDPVAPGPAKTGTVAGGTASTPIAGKSAPGRKPPRRRRFAMPDHEEDHERFDRSIATFLSGGRRVDGE